MSRWWVYQKERFPLLAHGPMVLVFVAAIQLFSSTQAGQLPDPVRLFAAAASALIFFFQLRVADEIKDRFIDRRYRPDRPVPRRLVSLKELADLAYIGGALQFAIALSIDIGLVPILVGVWLLIAAMTHEFFIAAWLKRHPAAYLLSHMAVMPAIAYYVSAFDWLCITRPEPHGIAWVLMLAYVCGVVLEVGRKVRTPDEERRGIQTYSNDWGMTTAIAVWSGSILLSLLAWQQAVRHLAPADVPWSFVLLVLVAVVGVAGAIRCRNLGSQLARWVEGSSAIVAMSLYLGLGSMHWL